MKAGISFIRLCILTAAVLVGLVGTGTDSVAYDTATGSKPEVQSKQTVDSQTHVILDFEICREAGGRYEQIGDILKGELGLTTTLVDLSNLDDDTDQIVIGDVTNATIYNWAAFFCLKAVDLGSEGYSFISMPNPRSSNGSWIIFILGGSGGTEGVFRGAMTLVDLVEGSGNGTIGNFRIRDYPDSPFRGMLHWIPQVTSPATAWVGDRKDSLETLAGTGCNTLLLGDADFLRMDDVIHSGLAGRWMNEVAYWSRYYGMEPVSQVIAVEWMHRADNPLWREGEYIENEPFEIVFDGQDYMFQPFLTPFDNDGYNMGFETPDGSMPEHWIISGNLTGWTYDTSNKMMAYDGSSATYLKQIWDVDEFEAGSYYVLEVVFSDVYNDETYTVPTLEVSCIGTAGWGYRARIFQETLIDYWLPTAMGTQTKVFYFWMPPTEADAPEGYPENWVWDINDNDPHPHFDDVEEISIMLYGVEPAKFTIHSFHLERRASSLRNVMLDPSNGLDLKVVDGNGLDRQGDFAINSPLNDLNWTMPTHQVVGTEVVDNVTTLEWTDTLNIPDTVWVSYTSGVPADWCVEGQRTTWCLKNAGYLDYIKDVLESFYKDYSIDTDLDGTTDASYALNPTYIDIRCDEIRGANRCGICADDGASNAQYLIDYVQEIQGMLDDLAITYPAAAETRLIISAGHFSSYGISIGGDPAYWWRYGGLWGATGDCDLGELAGLGNDVVFMMGRPERTYLARDDGWPLSQGTPGQDNLFVVARMANAGYRVSENEDDAEDWAPNPTWYEDDALGFCSIGYDEVFYEMERRLQDYAWKRYRNPDATLQAFINDRFVIDDNGTGVVEIDEDDIMEFYPFGHVEERDPQTTGYTITYAEINWGFGGPTVISNFPGSDWVSRQFAADGTFDVTLEVTAEPAGGGTAIISTAVITVDVEDTDPPDPPPGDKDNPLIQGTNIPDSYALYQNSPNPFNPTTEIRFDLPKDTPVRITIYNVKGELVKGLVDGRLSAGRKVVRWDGTNDHGRSASSGIYFYRIEAREFVETRKMILLR